MSTPPLPVACVLDRFSAADRKREQKLLQAFVNGYLTSSETESGVLFLVPPEPSFLAQLGELLAFERVCCPFLNFQLVLPEGSQPVQLEISGNTGVKEFVRATFCR